MFFAGGQRGESGRARLCPWRRGTGKRARQYGRFCPRGAGGEGGEGGFVRYGEGEGGGEGGFVRYDEGEGGKRGGVGGFVRAVRLRGAGPAWAVCPRGAGGSRQVGRRVILSVTTRPGASRPDGEQFCR